MTNRPSTRKRLTAVAALLLLSVLSLGLPAKVHPQASPIPQGRQDAHVVIISIDGLIPEYYVDPARFGLKVPNLVRMKLEGAYAEGVEGVFPSVTYPAHTSIITGVRPAVHGIIQNRIFEAPTETQTREWYWYAEALKVETLWSMARKAGLSTAAVGWPVTVGAEIDNNVPEISDPGEDPPSGSRRQPFPRTGTIRHKFWPPYCPTKCITAPPRD